MKDTMIRQAPINAWLIFGSQESLPTPEDLDDEVGGWTAPKRTAPGDLLFYYFIAPLKAVLFVSRATSYAEFDDDSDVASTVQMDRHQWWVETSRMIPIPPIPVQLLRQMVPGIIFQSHSGKYLRPNYVQALMDEIRRNATRDEWAQLARVLVRPTGLPDLPADPATLSLEEWTKIASGALALEDHVETYIVEPLLRMALHDEVTWQQQFPVRFPGAYHPGLADYGIIKNGRVVGVIEVKQNIQRIDFDQARRYADALDVPSLLIDANRIMLIERGSRSPSHQIERRTATRDDLDTIAGHIIGGRQQPPLDRRRPDPSPNPPDTPRQTPADDGETNVTLLPRPERRRPTQRWTPGRDES